MSFSSLGMTTSPDIPQTYCVVRNIVSDIVGCECLGRGTTPTFRPVGRRGHRNLGTAYTCLSSGLKLITARDHLHDTTETADTAEQTEKDREDRTGRDG